MPDFIDIRTPSPDSDRATAGASAASTPQRHVRQRAPMTLAERVSAQSSRRATESYNPSRRPTESNTASRATTEEIVVDDSDDDDVQFAGARAGPGPRSLRTSLAHRRRAAVPRISREQFQNAMDEDIDHALARNQADMTALQAEEEALARRTNTDRELSAAARRAQTQRREEADRDARQDRRRAQVFLDVLDREVRSPPPAHPRIGLGGAVYRRGNDEVRFLPGRRAQRFRVNPEEPPAAVPTIRRETYPMDINNPNYNPDVPELRPRNPAPAAALEAPGMMRVVGGWTRGLGNLGFGGRLQEVMGALGFGPVPGLGLGLGLGAGPAGFGGGDDIPTILAKVGADAIPPARKGFTRSWDADELGKDQGVITVDEEGDVVRAPKRKPYLACAACPEPLRASAGERGAEDRVWALRCGHVLDQRCFERLAWGTEEAEVPEETPNKRRRTSKPRAKKKAPPSEYAWPCPVCSREHVSVLLEGKWVPKPGVGGIQVYV